MNCFAPERCWEITGEEHGSDHVHECAIHAFGDAVGGAGICRSWFVRNAVFIEEGGDCLECLTLIFAAFIGSEDLQTMRLGLVLDKCEPRSENLQNGGGGFVGKNVYPDVPSSFVDKGDEVQSMTE